MYYRTMTYVAADWDSDKDAVDQLYQWNESKHWSISFTNAHEKLPSSRDSSLECTIKKSLKERMDRSKCFVLIVGEHTDGLTKGGCQLCRSYNNHTKYCMRGGHVDTDSFIHYECKEAIKADIKIIVLYKGNRIQKSKCPEFVKDIGIHVSMGEVGSWDYQSVKRAFEESEK